MYQLVIADAQNLLDFYTELEKNFPVLPRQDTEPRAVFPQSEWVVNNTPTTAAKRSDNKTGYTGVNYCSGKWEAKIAYHGVRYTLGRFEELQQAITARQLAEADLKEDPEKFVSKYSKKCKA